MVVEVRMGTIVELGIVIRRVTRRVFNELGTVIR
jgi:hypothetical protein